jgi:uncharacterized membrane protein
MKPLSSLSHKRPRTQQPNSEPRWPALVAILVVGGLNLAQPKSISFGPSWGLLVVIILLSIPTILTHRAQLDELNQMFGYLVAGVETFALVASVCALVSLLPKGTEAPIPLLKSAALLWITNIIVFALWYWRLDAGGPHKRDACDGHTRGAFLFPQMTLDDDSPAKQRNWSPLFVDYLFLAFNTSTAFSPTDSPVLSRWAKVLTMLQSGISLTIITLLAARAVNILTG